MKQKIGASVLLLILTVFIFEFLIRRPLAADTQVENIPEVVTVPSLVPTVEASPIPTLVPSYVPPPPPRVLDGGKLFALVNGYRQSNGLAPMEWYHPLCSFSQARSQQIESDWSHSGFDSSKDALFSSVCPECSKVGENLAKDFYDENSVLQGWIKSPGHKANLDGDWTWGCAIFYSNNYVSFVFGKKK